MTKISVHRYDHDNQPIGIEGWFTLESADAMVEADPMTAERHAAAMRRGNVARGVVETLYHTDGGRWVHKIAWHVGPRGQWVDDETEAGTGDLGPRYRFVSDGEALDWLTRNGYHDRITAYLPDLPDETGPGRPEIGGLVQVRLGKLLPSIDAYAAEQTCTRAEAVRRLVLAGLAGERG